MKEKPKNKTSKQSKTPEASKSQNRLTGVVLFIILCWTFISFYPSLNDGFTTWDDQDYVYENQLVQQKHIAVKEIFTTPVSLNYHPLTMLSLAYDYQRAKLNPVTYHRTNLFFHLFNTLLVFIFIYILSGIFKVPSSAGKLKPPRLWENHQLIVASIVSLFFGIHPLHVESVTWVSERKDVLYTFFYLAALIVYLKHLEKPKFVTWVSVFLLFIFSCLSKGVAVTLPVLMLLLDYFTGRKITLKVMLEKLPFLVLSFVFGIIALRIQTHAMVGMRELTAFQRFIFACYGFDMYMVKMLVPCHLSAIYPYPSSDSHVFVPGIYYITPVIAAALFLLCIRVFSKMKWILFGLLFYFITIALVLQFISVGTVIMADRYTYMPYIGNYFIIGTACSYVLRSGSPQWKPLKNMLPVVIILYALVLSYITYDRTTVWKNGITLWTDAIQKEPSAAVAYNGRASARGRDLGDYAGALQDCNQAILLNSKFMEAYSNRASAKSSMGDYKGALEDYNKAITLDSTKMGIYKMRAHVNDLLKNYKDGIADYDKAIMQTPNDADLFNDRGTLKGKANDLEGAIKDFSEAIQLSPEMGLAYYNRGICESLLQRKTEACADWQKAFDLGYGEAEKNLCK